jgi:hypothetical protein
LAPSVLGRQDLHASAANCQPSDARRLAAARWHVDLSPIASKRSGLTSRRDHEEARGASPGRADQAPARRSLEAA